VNGRPGKKFAPWGDVSPYNVDQDKALGIQGPVKHEEQVKALHIYVDEMDMSIARPQLMEVYDSQLSTDPKFPLQICMQLVPEMDTVLNTKGQKNVNKLCACQNTWDSSKLIYIKTREIELLDDQNEKTLDVIVGCNDRFAISYKFEIYFVPFDW